MVTYSPVRRARLAALASALAVLASMLIGTGSVAAATTYKVPTCHYDRTANVYRFIVVSSKSANPNLPRGDYLADMRLAGKTIYGLAYTETDGLTGFSPCDQLVGALYETGTDGVLSAGDHVLLGKYPTAYTAPFGFTAFASGGGDMVGAPTCDSGTLMADLGGGQAAFWTTTAGGAFGAGDLLGAAQNFVDLMDNMGGGSIANYFDHIITMTDGTYADTTKPDEGDNSWLNVSISSCPA